MSGRERERERAKIDVELAWLQFRCLTLHYSIDSQSVFPMCISVLCFCSVNRFETKESIPKEREIHAAVAAVDPFIFRVLLTNARNITLSQIHSVCVSYISCMCYVWDCTVRCLVWIVVVVVVLLFVIVVVIVDVAQAFELWRNVIFIFI